MVIQVFPDWPTSQTLRTDNPDEVGNFKHHLGTLTRKNLGLLNLEDEAKALKERVEQQIRNSQTQAEAHRLVQEIDSWLTKHSEVLRIVRVAEIRTLLKPGQGLPIGAETCCFQKPSFPGFQSGSCITKSGLLRENGAEAGNTHQRK